MLEALAAALVATAWLAWCFALLQLASDQRRTGLVVLLLATVGGVAALLGRSPNDVGFGWLRLQSLRSDAVALGALVPTAATVGGLLAAHTRWRRWSLATGIGAALACAGAGVVAASIGRAGWYWEFVAIVAGGFGLLACAAWPALRRGADPNARVVLGTAAVFGAFLAVGGALMLLAWRALD